MISLELEVVYWSELQHGLRGETNVMLPLHHDTLKSYLKDDLSTCDILINFRIIYNVSKIAQIHQLLDHSPENMQGRNSISLYLRHVSGLYLRHVSGTRSRRHC